MYKREKGTLILFTFMTLKTVFKIKDSWIKLVLREEKKGEQKLILQIGILFFSKSGISRPDPEFIIHAANSLAKSSACFKTVSVANFCISGG